MKHRKTLKKDISAKDVRSHAGHKTDFIFEGDSSFRSQFCESSFNDLCRNSNEELKS